MHARAVSFVKHHTVSLISAALLKQASSSNSVFPCSRSFLIHIDHFDETAQSLAEKRGHGLKVTRLLPEFPNFFIAIDTWDAWILSPSTFPESKILLSTF